MAISAHGTILAHAPSGGAYADVGELGDFTLPGVTRNEFDASHHNSTIDSWVMGMLRRDPITFPVMWNKSTATHVALRTSILNKTYDGFKLTFPDGDVWVGSGYVRQVAQTAPVDGLFTANVTVRLSGAMIINGTVVGTGQ